MRVLTNIAPVFEYDEQIDGSKIRRISRRELKNDEDYITWEVLKTLDKRRISGVEKDGLAICLTKQLMLDWYPQNNSAGVPRRIRDYLASDEGQRFRKLRPLPIWASFFLATQHPPLKTPQHRCNDNTHIFRVPCVP